MSGGVIPVGLVVVLGIWWAAAPESAIRFYRNLGNKQLSWLGPGMVRVIGLWVLVTAATMAIALAIRS